jgi:predicted CXXCH cytochrome family protein
VEGELAGLGTVLEEESGYAYHFEHGDGGPRIVETRPERPEHRLEAPLLYAIGAGELDRAFVARRGGLEFFAPLEVLSGTGGRHAELAPGLQAVPGQRFGVPITHECLGCHTDRLPEQGFPLNAVREPGWEPAGIGCGACHGEIEAHARWRAEAAGDPGRGPDPVLRAGTLSREERMSLCAACHLQGDVRIPLEGRLGVPPPGGDLLDELAVFVGREETEAIGFVSQTGRLVRSRCYLEDDSLACDTCHDPHRSVFDQAERTRVRAACQGCHPGPLELPGAQASPCARSPGLSVEGRDCVECHMPITPTFDVPGVRIHDHRIARRPQVAEPPARPRSLEAPDGDWVRFAWPGRPAPAEADDPGLWMMALAARGHPARALGLVDEAPSARVERLSGYHESRARLLENPGRFPEAAAAYERALRLDAGATSAAINLGLLYGLGGDPARGIRLLSQVIAYHPLAFNALRNRAGLRYELGDTDGFVADLEAAFEAWPQAEVAEILADWHRASGADERASAWDARAHALEPVESAGDAVESVEDE